MSKEKDHNEGKESETEHFNDYVIKKTLIYGNMEEMKLI